MAKQKNQINKFIPILIGIVIIGVFVVAGGFVFAANQESNDPFCASCHTQPETTYFQRSTDGQLVDMASYHTTKKTKCIDCHSGSGIFGRVQAELLGARNAFKYYTKTAVQPAVLTYPIKASNCLKCHQNVTSNSYSPKQQISVPGGIRSSEEARVGHWHVFLFRWQLSSSKAGSCVNCHSGHSTSVNAQNGYLNDQNVEATCEGCHQVLRGND